MRKTKMLILVLMAAFLAIGPIVAQESGAQTSQTASVKKMTLTGKIAKSRYGYVIRSRRGNAPSEIYTILNAEPGVLDRLVKSETIVRIETRIISGDNVAIESIDGHAYPAPQQ